MKRPPDIAPLDRVREMRKLSTDAERMLWKHLRGRQIEGAKFRRQVWLGDYIVHFVCLDAKLIIEADGAHHADAVDYDERRTAVLAIQGFTVLRFWNNEILQNIDGVLRVIGIHLVAEPSPSHSARAERAPPSPQVGEGI